MKNKFISTLLLLTACFGLHADDEFCEPVCLPTVREGFYVGALGGVNFQENASTEYFGYKVKAKWKPGYLAGGNFGYKFNNGMRLEGEVSYRRNNSNSISVNGVTIDNFKSVNDTLSYLFNTYYDIDTATDFTPYVGVGVGYVTGYGRSEVSGSSSLFSLKDNRDGLCWQAIAGVSYNLMCNTELSLDYRFFQAHEEFNEHAIALGLKYFFY